MLLKDLQKLEVVDAVIPEPLGGAHRDHHVMASRVKVYLRNCVRELIAVPRDELIEARYQKFRRMGMFFEGSQVPEPHYAEQPLTEESGQQTEAPVDSQPG